MNILGDTVDYFVINESNITFTGKQKPLYFSENRERFKKWDDKIIHHVTEDYNETLEKYWEGVPYHRSMKEDNIYTLPIYYQRACFHKDSAIYALLDCADDNDIILTSDADEIINPLALEAIDKWFIPDRHYVMVGPVYYYYLNLLCEKEWMGTRVCTMKTLKTMSIDKLRQSHDKSWKIMDGGWHWSFFGDADTVRAKMDAYEHQENNLPQFRNTMEERIEKGIDPFGRDYLYNPKVVQIDDSFPDYIIQNQDILRRFIK